MATLGLQILLESVRELIANSYPEINHKLEKWMIGIMVFVTVVKLAPYDTDGREGMTPICGTTVARKKGRVGKENKLLSLSGILIVFFCDIIMSHYTRYVFATISFIAETFIFLYVSMDALFTDKWKASSARLTGDEIEWMTSWMPRVPLLYRGGNEPWISLLGYGTLESNPSRTSEQLIQAWKRTQRMRLGPLIDKVTFDYQIWKAMRPRDIVLLPDESIKNLGAVDPSMEKNTKNEVMASNDDIRIIIESLDNREKPSSEERFSSDWLHQASDQVIAGDLGNNCIRKSKKKSLAEDPLQLCEVSFDERKWGIYKVPYPLREKNEKAYEPNVISIGPDHRGKERLKSMEVIKRHCFNRMIKQRKDEAKKFVSAMKDMEKKVREFYEQPLECIDSDTFVEMMVLDGCFIVLLFQLNDYLVNILCKMKKGTHDEIFYDLLLVENQLPFFVLLKLYDMIKTSSVEFPTLVFSFYSKGLLPGPGICHPGRFPKPVSIKHLLGFVNGCWLPSEPEVEAEVKAKETIAQCLRKFICCRGKQVVQRLRNFIYRGREQEEEGSNRSWKFIRSATELEEAGINFEKKVWKQKEGLETELKKMSLFDVEFTDDGTLKIPILRVEDNTERILRNFLAHEQFLRSSKSTYVGDYVMLMDNLINSGKDVQLLCKQGIVVNCLGDDEVVAQMFNKLGDAIYVHNDFNNFYYADIFDNVDKHCKKRRNKWKGKLKKWKAKLMKDYFNSPWSFISVVTAVVLLLLTAVQTIFSVLSYFHPQ
ncbi:UPF0481 protein At3g47200-like [Durio zibethinus]|uniref:UPF0481 protein At3g47200-like n=1 Tax=Durio zibethinus TaxID=66656 RepID=A0A6P5YU67_DURZI|nr:UPF0481 protein At3g47200-like [Durio zibethinus]